MTKAAKGPSKTGKKSVSKAGKKVISKEVITPGFANVGRRTVDKNKSKAAGREVVKPVGLSLHIGMNDVDYKNKYWKRYKMSHLGACHRDAQYMATIAQKQGCKLSVVLLDNEATVTSVPALIRSAAAQLQSGDLFLLTYSGHGGQEKVITGKTFDDDDGLDETWCLFDAQLRDDSISDCLGAFQEGVRIVVMSDSCHSGSCVDGVTATPRADCLNGSVILFSGCADAEFSRDGDVNSAFTAAVKYVWKGGKFAGDYKTFYEKVRARFANQKHLPIEDQQNPKFSTTGRANLDFVAEKPFTL